MLVKLYMCGGEKPTSEYPLGLGYLKSNCESKNITIQIVHDKNALFNADLIGLSCGAYGVAEAVEILDRSSVPVVIGGQASLWEGLKNYAFQHIVVGEGERAFKAILNGEVSVDRKLVRFDQIDDIDSIKFPERGNCKDVVPVFTTRGCPYDCYFCSSQTFWDKVRFHSPEYFFNEISYIEQRYTNCKQIYILDDLFVCNKPRLKEICETWIKRELQKKYSLASFVRSNIFDEEIAQIMKDMNFDYVRFGLESGSDRVLKLLNKRTTVANAQKTIDIANKVGLPVCFSIMRNIPGETKEDAAMTKDFVLRNTGKASISGSYLFQGFPGTRFYNGEDLVTVDMRVREKK